MGQSLHQKTLMQYFSSYHFCRYHWGSKFIFPKSEDQSFKWDIFRFDCNPVEDSRVFKACLLFQRNNINVLISLTIIAFLILKGWCVFSTNTPDETIEIDIKDNRHRTTRSEQEEKKKTSTRPLGDSMYTQKWNKNSSSLLLPSDQADFFQWKYY